MATSFEDVYKKFYTLVPSTYLSSLDADTLKELLYNYIDKAISIDFKKCRTDLTDITTVDDDPLLTYPQFDNTVSSQEQWILAYGMAMTYMESKLRQEEIMRTSITTEDYSESSNANQIDKLVLLFNTLKSDLREKIIS